MTNYYTHAAFSFECGTVENAETVAKMINQVASSGLVNELPPDLLQKMIEIEPDDIDEGELLSNLADHASVDGINIFITISESSNIELLACLLGWAMHTMPEVPDRQSFEWANTCDKDRSDAFGGGACFISRDGGIEIMSTYDWIHSRREAQPAQPIAVVLEGGLVQCVVSKAPEMIGRHYVVIDYDTDDIDDGELEQIEQADGKKVSAVCHDGLIQAATITIP